MSNIKQFIDPEVLAEQDGRALGHQEAMQEVLSKLRREYEVLSSCLKQLPSESTAYQCCFFQRGLVKSLVRDLFNEDEANKLVIE